MILNFGLNLQIISIFVLMPLTGFVLTASVCLLEERLQTYMEVFSGVFMLYFVSVWVYWLFTDAALSPLLKISLSRPIELILYISAGTGMILGTLAVRSNIYQRLKDLIAERKE